MMNIIDGPFTGKEKHHLRDFPHSLSFVKSLL
jgi:hypothetical protein